MKTKNWLAGVGILCMGLMMVFFASGVAQAQAKGEVIKLKFANFLPPGAKQTTVFQEFNRDLEARTKGRITVQYLFGGSLLTGPAMYKGLESGIADIGYSNVFYTAGRMPVTEFGGLPFGYSSAWVATHVLNDFYFKVKPKEWDNVQLLFLNGSCPNIFISTKPIRTLEDLKGLSLRAPGVAGEIVSALGGTPSPLPMAETYEAISKGAIQGGLLDIESLKTWRFADVVKYTTNCWQVGSTYPFYLAMNKNSYNKLPPDLRGIFDTLVGQYTERVGLMWNEIDLEGKAFGEQKGVQFIDLTDEEAARWKDALKPLTESWVKKMVGLGYAESEVREWLSFIAERVDYYTKKQIEYCIPSVTGPPAIRPEKIGKSFL